MNISQRMCSSNFSFAIDMLGYKLNMCSILLKINKYPECNVYDSTN